MELATSLPLFCPLLLTRSLACSKVSQVRTPKPTGAVADSSWIFIRA